MKLKNIFIPYFVLYLLFINISIVFADPQTENQDILMPPELSCEGAVLIDAKTGIVLYGKNMHATYYPASITKVMTALLTIENTKEDDRIVFSDNAVFGIERSSSNIAMDVDETLSVNEALYAIMLASANEVCMALAEHISGTVEDFAALMTKRAKELGALNTNFVNPHGLPSNEHVTTPYDMAQIARKAVSYDKFVTLIQTKSHKIPPTEKQPEERPLNNTNRMILPGQFFYENAVGGKTGYTDEARHTLVTYGKKDNIELIVAVMKGEKNEPYTDTKNLLEYGFKMFHLAHIFDKDSFLETKDIIQAGSDVKLGEAEIKAEKSLTIQVPKAVTLDKITTRVSLPESLSANVSVGDVVGTLTVMYEAYAISEVNLFIKNIEQWEVKSGAYESDINDDKVTKTNDTANDTEDVEPVKSDSFNFLPIAILVVLLAAFVVLVSNRQRRLLLEIKSKEIISLISNLIAKRRA